MQCVQLRWKHAACNSSAVVCVSVDKFVSYLTTPLVSRLYIIDDRTINKYGAVGGLIIGRGNRIARRKSTAMPLCLPLIPHDLS
jgi:hypothetical protein